jgi:hypothetical protein
MSVLAFAEELLTCFVIKLVSVQAHRVCLLAKISATLVERRTCFVIEPVGTCTELRGFCVKLFSVHVYDYTADV